MYEYTFVKDGKEINIKTDRKMTDSQEAKYERCFGKRKAFVEECRPKATAQQYL